MKNNTALFVMISLLTITSLYGQYQEPTKSAQYEAGLLLQKFSKQYFAGTALVGGGYLFTTLALSGNQPNEPMVIAGSLMALCGAVVMIASHGQIGKAGEKLMISSQSLSYTGERVNSLGIRWKIGSSKQHRFLAGN